MKITVLGAGGWGTALAKLLCESGAEAVLWGHNPAHLEELRQTASNQRYLPDVRLPETCRIEANLHEAVRTAELIVVAVPSKAFREVTSELAEFDGITVSVTNGIEYERGLTMSGVLRETMPRARVVALSGPTLALEVARGVPTAAVAASPHAADAETVQALFHRPTFRVYTNADVIGVELGGALKNVIAIAAGTADGLGFGDNSKAALITRGIVEMQRLGVACGAAAETFAGLSGLGDLTVTCFSRLSRNRGLGERLGRGETLSTILASTETVAEGHPTSRAAIQLARRLNVVTPIMDEVYAMLYEEKNVAQALRDLTNRDSKAES
ncbi:MAG: NAD(P)H-dependent glycerol-3-phosphate dehydrogenase [Verrucomicrobiota bacterium]